MFHISYFQKLFHISYFKYMKRIFAAKFFSIMSRVLSEQEQLRRQSLEDLRKLGIDPYPADLFPVDSHAKKIKGN